MKILASILIALAVLSPCYAENTSYGADMYAVTLNTTTFTAVPNGRKNYLYNPGLFDIKLASSTTSVAANRWTVKAAQYLPFTVEINCPLYAIATNTDSVRLENLAGR